MHAVASLNPTSFARGVSRAVTRSMMRPPMTPNRFVRRLLAPELSEVVGGRVAVVTGASSGIGEATALHLARAGAIVVLVARRAENLQEVAKEIKAEGGVAHVMPCDLSDLDAIQKLAADILKKHGPVEVLVNNAGRSIRRPLDESFDRMHDFERTMQVNYFGAVQLTMALLPTMLEQGSGRIVNVATWGVRIEATPLFGAYTASKTALAAFGRTLNVEVAKRGVSVSTVNPALVKTPMIAPTAAFEASPSLRPEEIAEQIAEAIVTRTIRIDPRIAIMSSAVDTFFPEINDLVARLGFTPRDTE